MNADPRSLAMTRADDVEWAGGKVSAAYAGRLSSLRGELAIVLGLDWLTGGDNRLNVGGCGSSMPDWYNPVGYGE
jgi:hypothetical protein